jgi:hypothetical protein
MRISRRILAPLALPCALLCTLAGAAAAQATVVVSPTDGTYTNDTTPTVTYTDADAIVTVSLTADGDPAGSSTSGIGGAGSIVADHPLASTNSSGTSLSLSDGDTALGTVDHVHIDTVPDLTGGNVDPEDAADISFNASSAIPGHAVELWDTGADGVPGGVDADVKIATATANASGDDIGSAMNITTTVPLTPGSHTVYAVSKDAGGLASSPSESTTFDVAPPAPTFAQLFDNARVNQLRPPVAVTGVDPSASVVKLYAIVDHGSGGVLDPMGSTSTVTSGTATIVPTSDLDDDNVDTHGINSLVITQTVNDVESLTNGVADANVSIFVRASPPVLSTSFSGPLTNDPTPYFNASNTLENSGADQALTRLYLDGQLVGHSDPTFGGGDDSVQADNPILDGAHNAYVVTVDDLGHVSTVHSNTVSFTVDTVGPVPPTVTSPVAGSTVATALPTITITTEPGAPAYVYLDDAGEEVLTTADGSGHATFVLTQALADGLHTLHTFSQDAAGNYGDVTDSTFTVATPKPPAPPAPVAPVVTPTPPAPTAPKTDPDGDGISNGWTVGGKVAPAPATPKASVTGGKVTLKLAAAPKGAKSVRVYREDGNGGYKLVKTLTPKSKSFTDTKVKAGHSYKYKTVGVNAKGQQGKASGTATAKVKKK